MDFFPELHLGSRFLCDLFRILIIDNQELFPAHEFHFFEIELHYLGVGK